MRIGALTLWSFALCVTFGFNSVSSHAQGVNVTTWHNDVGRAGQNTNETALTTTLVENYNQFGKLCTASLDGSRIRSAARRRECKVSRTNSG